MRILISLDYELFFGKVSKDIDKCLINPTKNILDIFNKYNIKANFFVDAGYLYALKRQKDDISELKISFEKVLNQIHCIDRHGHEIGLHLHPHWEDCIYSNGEWKVNLSRYKLSDFGKKEGKELFYKYYNILKGAYSRQINSYRAGGWCLEPFSLILDPMRECGIYIDSTVYHNGYYESKTHSFDFRNYPPFDTWRFNSYPSIVEENGFFTEFPISSHKVHPFSYWKVLLKRLFRLQDDAGIGAPVKPSLSFSAKKLLWGTTDVVSIDALKSQLVLKSFKKYEKLNGNYFCLIGHPKCFDEKTYQDLEEFINYALSNGHTFCTYSECLPVNS